LFPTELVQLSPDTTLQDFAGLRGGVVIPARKQQVNGIKTLDDDIERDLS